MLFLLDGQLVRGRFEYVVPHEFTIRITDRAELWHGFERVITGFSWYGFGVDIDPKTGKIGKKHGKNPKIRCVFGGQSLDMPLIQ